MGDKYKEEVIDPGDRASQLAHAVCMESYRNCPAVIVVPHEPGNFRGPVDFVLAKHIALALANYSQEETDAVTSWEMALAAENDGAGGKPQFFTLLGTLEVFQSLGWEIITMTADDMARWGKFPAVMINEVNFKRVTSENFPFVQAMFEGYGAALKTAGLVNITGETAVMKHSITAFCDTGAVEELVLTWGGTCIGLTHKERLIDGSKIKPGMPVVGFAECGYRCNGGTALTNIILRIYGPEIEKIRQNAEAREFIQMVTIPSISYAKTVTRLLGWNPDGSLSDPLASIYGIAHITGGGVWAKFREILPDRIGAHLDNMPQPPEVLRRAQELSWSIPDLKLTDHQCYGTFQGGCGMLLVCKNEQDAGTIIEEAAKDGIEAQVVGLTVLESQKKITIVSRFKEGAILCSED